MTKGHKWSSKPGQGAAVKFLRDHVSYASDDCLIWPFSRHPTGYASFGYLGKSYYAHRFMCRLVHGAPPSPEHKQTSHSCHNPRCVNPRHLSWATASQNMLDKRANGTQSNNGGHGRKGKLSPEQVAEIRAVKGTETLATTAARFNVTIKTIRSVQNGESYTGKVVDWFEVNRRGAETKRRNATASF